MQSVLATNHLANSTARPQPVQHQYGTRIRQNSVIKPSARLRQSPDPPAIPRKIKPNLLPKASSSNQPANINDFPQFPPPDVLLHPDDATSKVFLAIGRSFLSVDNRAMTIKDLAEMTLNFGLVCQNVSAAGQAITTYIRTHLNRCEVQQDQPLLMRHVLSGTPSDDDLLLALHSRSGGAHCTVSAERSTNFRRGTMVWYLSKATGAPCPFTRVGIRLCDYSENGKVGTGSASKERKRERDRQRRSEQCGQKRKRPLRGCIDKGSESDSLSEDGKPPPKVKLTLRLKPFLNRSSSANDLTPSRSTSDPSKIIDLSKDSDFDSDDESMSVDSSDDERSSPTIKPIEEVPWSLPPYPRRSISIPCYTPSLDGPYPYFPIATQGANYTHKLTRRSPSVTHSIASPPPDSEDEDDDYHISMTGARHCSTDRYRLPVTSEIDWDLDFDSEGETMWESPGPRSPSAPIIQPFAEVTVKQEPRDVQGMLDAWEDFDYSVADPKVVEVVAHATDVLDTESLGDVKVEALDSWDWDAAIKSATPDAWTPVGLVEEEEKSIKQEEIEFETPFIFPHNAGSQSNCIEAGPSSPMSSLSSLSSNGSGFCHSESPKAEVSRRHSEFTWKDVELLGPDTICPQEFDEDEWQEGSKGSGTVRARAKTTSILPSFMAKSSSSLLTSPRSPPLAFVEPSNVATVVPHRDLEPVHPSSPSSSQSLASLIQSMSMGSPSTLGPIGPSYPWAVSSPALSPGMRSPDPEDADVVVVHTCQPCTPAISATQVEGISVYHMTLGISSLLRRIDTDFVHLSPIISYLRLPCPSPMTMTNATVVSQGSPSVSGTWVPLSVAQAFARDHPLPDGLLDVFLSDVLFERFPSALQDFHRSNTPGRMLNQFGPHFSSTVKAQQDSPLSVQTQMSLGPALWEAESFPIWSRDDRRQFSSAFALSRSLALEEAVTAEPPPLSATEQEMFQALCTSPDWDKENPAPASASSIEDKVSTVVDDDCTMSTPDESAQLHSSEHSDRPLRRSKRVANAVAARAPLRGRPQRRGPRNSLS